MAGRAGEDARQRRAAGEEVAVPTQDRVGAYQQPQTPQRRPRQSVQQRGQQRAIGRGEPDLLRAELALQHRDLVAQRQDFDVPVSIMDRQQPQQRERIRHTQVCQSQEHKTASSRSHR